MKKIQKPRSLGNGKPMARASKLRIEKDELIFNGKFVRVMKRHFRDRKGARRVWEMAKRKTYGRIVAVVALTPKKEVILIRIYRIPLRSWIIECCAGLMDRAGESEKTVARRELLEETGYAVKRLRTLMSGPFNAGLLADDIVYYLGTGARKVRDPAPEDSEDIEVLRVPLRKLESFLLNPPRGTKVDLKLFGILHFLQHTPTSRNRMRRR